MFLCTGVPYEYGAHATAALTRWRRMQGATCFGDDSALDASSEHPHQDRRALEWGHGSWPEGLRECDESGGGDKISWEVAGTHGRRGCVHGRGLYVCHNTSAVDTARGGSKCLLASGAEARVCGQTGGEVRLCGGVLVPGLVLGVSAARVAAVGIDEVPSPFAVPHSGTKH